MNDTPTYEQALQELQTIVQSLEAGTIPIDQLSQKVEQATQLIQYCQSKLRHTEKHLNDLFSEQ